MNTLAPRLTTLAGLLEYPGREFHERLAGNGTDCQSAAPQVSKLPNARADTEPGRLDIGDRADLKSALQRFVGAMSALSPDEREELYTATFDVMPACVPYVSIHLFGEENFKRGEFMAGLQARYAEAGFSAGGELPDHLCVLLRFAAQAGETERRELVEFCLLGPLGRMMEGLSEANPYRALLESVRETLQSACPGVRPAASPVEQMRSHGTACDGTGAGCGCGAARIHDGLEDDSQADAPFRPPSPGAAAALSPRL
jgi:nitrate reductase molybdenum cofactor assembly chaperone NarJ/NarW